MGAESAPPTGSSISAKRVLLLGLWFSLAVGLLQAAIVVVGRLFFGAFAWHGYYVVWMAPLASAMIFVPAAVGTGVVSLGLPSRIRGPAIAGVLTAIGVLNTLLLFPTINLVAMAVLAAGIGWRVFAKLRQSAAPPSDRRLVRQAGVMVGAAAAGALVVHGGAALVEWNAVRTTPAANGAHPNVLLIVLDTEGAQGLDLYGYGRPTSPALGRFAASGANFENAIATAPWTLPSHASMLTGRHGHEIRGDYVNPMEAVFPTLTQALRDAGYVTGGFVGNVNYAGRVIGIGRGFQHFEDYRISFQEVVIHSALLMRATSSGRVRRLLGFYDVISRKRSPEIFGSFLRWSGSQRKPWFALINIYDVHEPYLPPSPYDQKYGDARIESRNFSGTLYRYRSALLNVPYRRRLSPQLQSAERAAYDGSIEYVDGQLDSLFTELERRGQLDNSIVVITSDHGEQFGERGTFLHGDRLGIEVLHVPLVFRYPPAVPAGRRVAAPVSLRHLPATILDLAGVSNSLGLPGSSLAAWWRDSTPPVEEPILASQLPLKGNRCFSVLIGGLQYRRSADGEVLEEFASSRDSALNLLGDSASQPVLARARRVLDSVLREAPPYQPKKWEVIGNRPFKIC